MIRAVLGFIIRFMIGFLATFGTIYAGEWLYYHYLDDYTLPEITVPMEVLNENNQVQRGEILVYNITYTKPEDISPIRTIRQIICMDGNLVTMTSTGAKLPIAKEPRTITSKSIVIPEKVSNGDCRLELSSTFQPNPYKQEEKLFYSEWFEVIQ